MTSMWFYAKKTLYSVVFLTVHVLWQVLSYRELTAQDAPSEYTRNLDPSYSQYPGRFSNIVVFRTITFVILHKPTDLLQEEISIHREKRPWPSAAQYLRRTWNAPLTGNHDWRCVLAAVHMCSNPDDDPQICTEINEERWSEKEFKVIMSCKGRKCNF